jgi:fatty-acyl-CoA synthase
MIAIPQKIVENACRLKSSIFLRLITKNGSAQEYRYIELMTRAAAWMTLYLERGLKVNSHVVVVLPHSLDLYASYLGALMAGMIPAMFAFPSVKFSQEEYLKTFDKLIDNASPELIVTYPELKDELSPVLCAGSRSIVVCTSFDVEFSKAPSALDFIADPNPDDIAFLQYSSGTTGIKKGVAISHRALLWQIESYSQAIGLRGDDIIVSWLPLYHDMGLICCYFLPLITGTPVVAMSPFDWVRHPSMWASAVSDYRGTLCWLPNFAYNFLAKNISDDQLHGIELSSLRGVVNCSESIMADSHSVFLERFSPYGLKAESLCCSYAMAENTFAVTSGGFGAEVIYEYIDSREFGVNSRAVAVSPVHPRRKLLVSSGRPLPQTNIVIVSGSGEVLPERQVGEIILRTPSLFHSYHRNHRVTSHDVAGKFRTGDLGYLAHGQLFVTGRKKDLIIVAGKNIYPQDVEEVINTVPGVIPGRCVAFGVPDAGQGTEKLIVLAETTVTVVDRQSEIRKQIYNRIACQTDVVPSAVRLLPHMWLLKSSSGKIARAANRERYKEMLHNESIGSEQYSSPKEPSPVPASLKICPQDHSDKASVVLFCIRSVLTQKGLVRDGQVGMDDVLITSGLIDSLTLISLIVEIESNTGVTLPPSCLDLSNFDTARKITNMLERLEGKRDKNDFATVAERMTMSFREKKCLYFLNRTDGIDSLILGSSKQQFLSVAVMREFGCDAYNFAVMSGRAEDWYCITRFVLDNNKCPLDNIVLGVDIEAFSNTVKMDTRLVNSAHLTQYLDAPEQIPIVQYDFDRCVPKNWRRERFNIILRQYKSGRATGPRGLYIPDDRTGETILIGAGREALYERTALNLQDPLDAGAEYVLRLKDFTCLDARRVAYFHRLVNLCIERGILLACFFSPLHPELDGFLSARTVYRHRLDEFRGVVSRIKHSGFYFFDTSVPAAFGGLENDFRDGAHIGKANSDILLRFIMARVGKRSCLTTN